ncbi:hypothetical protein SNE40_021432 [Patella caerulea]|uniref:DUF7869 domain-containing protein n=1 Tax=Patella caerulea TaxID=87958 RepID=A0AAN8GCN5_PATCE
MEFSKEENIARSLNSNLTSCNLHEAVNKKEFRDLVTEFFCIDDCVASSDESDEDSVCVEKHDFDFVNDSCDSDSDTDIENNENDVQLGLPVVDEVEKVLSSKEVNNTALSDVKDHEMSKIELYSCKNCKLNNGEPCFKLFSKDFVYELRMNMSSLSDFEKDLILLGKISCVFRNDPYTQSSKKKQKERKHPRTEHYVNGIRVCRETFKFLHCISQNKLTAVLKHYKEFGLTPREKKSGGRHASDKRLLTHDDICRVVTFIINFAELHALVLPGRVPGFKRFDIKLLPSHYTKSKVFLSYQTAMKEAGERVVNIVGFRRLWNALVPFIVRTKPMTDLCWVCQQNNSLIYKSANMSDQEKSVRCKTQEEHILKVTLERSLYNSMVQKARDVLKNLGVTELESTNPATRDITMHYSFDFAQQVHYPSNPLQPGPMYFLTPRKCGLFGINCEALPRQVNYLIDEGMCITKGSNAVISYLDHFFTSYGLGEMHLQLHCDNCCGQNKNNAILQYLSWRVIHGLHKSITLNFLISGHTKFAPDWAFGLIKQTYRRTMVSCLDEISEVVNSSTSTGVNTAQLVGHENGDILVQQRDWQSFLHPYFRCLPGIKKYQHFRCV